MKDNKFTAWNLPTSSAELIEILSKINQLKELPIIKYSKIWSNSKNKIIKTHKWRTNLKLILEINLGTWNLELKKAIKDKLTKEKDFINSIKLKLCVNKMINKLW